MRCPLTNIINGIDFDRPCICKHSLDYHWRDWNNRRDCNENDCKCNAFKLDNLLYLEQLSDSRE